MSSFLLEFKMFPRQQQQEQEQQQSFFKDLWAELAVKKVGFLNAKSKLAIDAVLTKASILTVIIQSAMLFGYSLLVLLIRAKYVLHCINHLISRDVISHANSFRSFKINVKIEI